MSQAVTFRDAVADHLKARPGQWVDGLTLATLGGAYAWRSRVSDCRTQLGLVIENRQRKMGERTISEYRLVVPLVRVYADLLQIAEAYAGE